MFQFYFSSSFVVGDIATGRKAQRVPKTQWSLNASFLNTQVIEPIFGCMMPYFFSRFHGSRASFGGGGVARFRRLTKW